MINEKIPNGFKFREHYLYIMGCLCNMGYAFIVINYLCGGQCTSNYLQCTFCKYFFHSHTYIIYKTREYKAR